MQPDFPKPPPPANPPAGPPASPKPPAPAMLLQVAALILAVRTARFDDREFEGLHTPRFMAQVANALAAANTLYRRARERYPEWF